MTSLALPIPTFVNLSTADLPTDWELLAEERRPVDNSTSAIRRNEFALGRYAAWLSLTRLGISRPRPLLTTPGGRGILWPESVAGSLSHSRGRAVAVTAFIKDVSSLGIDLEALNPDFNPRLTERICSKEELLWCNDAPFPRTLFIFSAKESLYKALRGLTSAQLRYHSFNLCWDQMSSCFHCRLLHPLDDNFSQSWTSQIRLVHDEQFVLTYCEI